MPFMKGAGARVFYRHWKAVSPPQAQIIFLHGYGEHSALYHRFANLMNTNRIDLWAPDAIGHGLSDGVRGDPSSVEELAENALRLTKVATAERPDLPMVLVGHSMGAITAVTMLGPGMSPFCGVVL